MPVYEFQTPDGRIVEQWYSAKNCPAIGSIVMIDRQPCVRVISFPQLNTRPAADQARVLKMDDAALSGFQHTSDGDVVIHNGHEEREALKRLNDGPCKAALARDVFADQKPPNEFCAKVKKEADALCGKLTQGVRS